MGRHWAGLTANVWTCRIVRLNSVCGVCNISMTDLVTRCDCEDIFGVLHDMTPALRRRSGHCLSPVVGRLSAPLALVSLALLSYPIFTCQYHEEHFLMGQPPLETACRRPSRVVAAWLLLFQPWTNMGLRRDFLMFLMHIIASLLASLTSLLFIL